MHAPPQDFGRAFLIGILLNAGFIIAQVIYGLKANSVALLADAGHNAGDVLSLILAWGASRLTKRLPSPRFTYGLRGSSILASLTNAVLLLVVVGGLAWESITRFASPEQSASGTVIAIALLGVAINGVTALLFFKGRKEDLNIKAAYLHMLADAGISLGVALSGVAVMATGWLWIDPLAGLAVSLVIIVGTVSLLKESLAMALQAVPEGIDPVSVRAILKNLPGVREVHDLHIWPISTTDIACSVHLVMPGGHPGDAFIRDIGCLLGGQYKICHTTVQIETGDGGECPLASDKVI